jgi:hypothetical protein
MWAVLRWYSGEARIQAGIFEVVHVGAVRKTKSSAHEQ